MVYLLKIRPVKPLIHPYGQVIHSLPTSYPQFPAILTGQLVFQLKVTSLHLISGKTLKLIYIF
jgi:hypothetical protein